MDLLDRLLAHDVWTTRQLLLQSRPLTDEQLDRRFDVDNRTLRECFEHIIDNMETWTDLLCERPVRDSSGLGPEAAAQAATIDGLLGRLSAIGREFAALSRSIARQNRWDDVYVDTLDRPPKQKTFGGTIAHLITHSMHHRAQAMYMLEQLGIHDHVEGDVLDWESMAFGWN